MTWREEVERLRRLESLGERQLRAEREVADRRIRRVWDHYERMARRELAIREWKERLGCRQRP